jgi:aryl-alcohol dehydrogenase-like predicted oxidoreductase
LTSWPARTSGRRSIGSDAITPSSSTNSRIPIVALNLVIPSSGALPIPTRSGAPSGRADTEPGRDLVADPSPRPPQRNKIQQDPRRTRDLVADPSPPPRPRNKIRAAPTQHPRRTRAAPAILLPIRRPDHPSATRSTNDINDTNDTYDAADSVCPARVGQDGGMNFRYLGNSGMQISEITYGNWLTHGSQVENDVATKCVQAALDAGITTFDTADVYANGAAETVLGEALKGERRESLEVFTKVFWPVGPEPKGKNDTGLSRKHMMEGIEGSLRRLQMDYVDLYQAHRYDVFTPLEETMQAFADIVRAGKALYIGVSEWTADQIRAAHGLAHDLGVHLVSSQPQYSMLWRVIEDEVVPTCAELGISQIVWSPIAQGVLTGKYKPGAELPAGSRATDDKGGADMIKRYLNDDVLTRVQALEPIAADLGLTMATLAVAWVLRNDNVAAALVGASRPEQVTENVKAAGVKIPDDAMKAIDDALGDVVTRDPAIVAKSVPKRRAI